MTVQNGQTLTHRFVGVNKRVARQTVVVVEVRTDLAHPNVVTGVVVQPVGQTRTLVVRVETLEPLG